jgi:hypothetical protein
MLFKVTHIDRGGRRHRAHVSAANVRDAMEQADREWGEARAMACVRMAVRPALGLVARAGGVLRGASGGGVCGF